LTLLIGSFDLQKPVPDMTYNVYGGTLNLALCSAVSHVQPCLCDILWISASVNFSRVHRVLLLSRATSCHTESRRPRDVENRRPVIADGIHHSL